MSITIGQRVPLATLGIREIKVIAAMDYAHGGLVVDFEDGSRLMVSAGGHLFYFGRGPAEDGPGDVTPAPPRSRQDKSQ